MGAIEEVNEEDNNNYSSTKGTSSIPKKQTVDDPNAVVLYVETRYCTVCNQD